MYARTYKCTREEGSAHACTQKGERDGARARDVGAAINSEQKAAENGLLGEVADGREMLYVPTALNPTTAIFRDFFNGILSCTRMDQIEIDDNDNDIDDLLQGGQIVPLS
jgi:hypothetical protein